MRAPGPRASESLGEPGPQGSRASFHIQRRQGSKSLLNPDLTRRRLLDCSADSWVSCTTADVARHGQVNIVVSRLGHALEQSHSRHHLTGLAVTALHHVDVEPRLLNRLADLGAADSFD